MIDVTHPDPVSHVKQELSLSAYRPDDRRYWELMYSYGNACYRYYQMTDDLQPTQQDYQEWLEALPEKVKQVEIKAGFDQSRRSFPFRRYVLEKAGHHLQDHVRSLLGEKVYAEFEDVVKPD